MHIAMLQRRSLEVLSQMRQLFRPNDYTPLATGPSGSGASYSKGYSIRSLLFGVVLVASIVLNICLVAVPLFSRSKSPLDNYQALNVYPILDDAALSRPQDSPPHPDDHAIVTTLYTDTFASAVATLGHSLRRANTTARLIVLYLPERISSSSLCLATSSGFIAHPVTRIPPPHNGKGVYSHFLDQFTKLNLWTLDTINVKSLVYLDADTLVRRNFDELFTLPFNFAAVPDVFLNSKGFTLSFNAGVMYLRPSTAVFNSMVEQIGTADFPPTDAEQSFLNHYYGAEAIRLPFAYNGNLAIKKRSPSLWEGTLAEQRIVHFTLVKPFLGNNYAPVAYDQMDEHVAKKAEEWDNGLFKDEMLWWGEMFKDMKRTYADALVQCGVATRSRG